MSDPMRREYRPLTDVEKKTMDSVKSIGQNFYDACDLIGTSRELSLAKTKVEEAVMWAVKHISR